MMVEWSENWRQNPSRTLPRKCTAMAEPMKAQTTRNCGANKRVITGKTRQKPHYNPESLAKITGALKAASAATATGYSPLINPASISRRLKRRASAPLLQA